MFSTFIVHIYEYYKVVGMTVPVYDLKYFQGLPFGLFEFEDL